MSRKKRQKKKPGKQPTFKRQEVEYGEVKKIIEQAPERPLTTEECLQLTAILETLLFLTQELEAKGTTLARLRKALFGSASEKTKDVLGQLDEQSSKDDASQETIDESKLDENNGENCDDVSSKTEQEPQKPKEKPKGHGRHSADSYFGATRLLIPHENLAHKDSCPCCVGGKVYRQKEPAVLVRVVGMAPLQATVIEKERLRCHLCGEVFTAESPEGIGDKKYDETASSMIGLLKYGSGLPFYRIEKLCINLGIPMPSSTQWDLVEEASGLLEVVWEELVRQAAMGDVIHIDDTKAKVLALNAELQAALEKDPNARKGIFTSGIVSRVENRDIVLFFTGNKHAGENLKEVLEQRDEELEPPIQMSDALALNMSQELQTIIANCLVHARRNFVDVVVNFPTEVEYILTELKKVYKYDAEAKKQELTKEERLEYHKKHSKPVMDRLEKWLSKQFDEKLIEPNSTLGAAIKYMQKHWSKLTLFLRVAGAPLDNNIVERILKRAILHRKNSLFYKTENGARVGDMFMSLIHTAEVNGENPFEYLVAVQRHHQNVKEAPADWMPWNYRETLVRLGLPPPKSNQKVAHND